MALIKCPGCGVDVSDKAEACPKCAFPLNSLNNLKEKEFEETNNEKENIKKISETKCTCNACQNVWYYGKKDVTDNILSVILNIGSASSDVLTCPCCGGSSPTRKVVDLDKCPKCNSRSVKKETIIHEVRE
jgi:hypothetical protein